MVDSEQRTEVAAQMPAVERGANNMALVGMCAKLPLWQLRGISCHFGNLPFRQRGIVVISGYVHQVAVAAT
jgi:hypothetical protein